MPDDSQYQGSQAYNHNVPSEESVSPNSGSVNYSKTLVNLRGVNSSIDLKVTLSYTPGTSGSFGAPRNWGIELPYVIPGKSLTAQGKSYVIDNGWTSSGGWQSGLRYVNSRGMLFESIFPVLALPSGRPGEYRWRFRASDGGTDYFDELGKLLEHADRYGNSLYFQYVDSMTGPLTARIDHILDSWGQKVQFEHEPDVSLTVIGPDGGKTKVVFGSQGVDAIEDALGLTTKLDYITLAGRTVINSITYPNGLKSVFEYVLLAALDENKTALSLPACSRNFQQDHDSNIVSDTIYEYGQETAWANFTGSSIGCCMGTAQDSLMESQNHDFRYDVAIKRMNGDKVLQMSRMVYNYLHLAMSEDHFNVNIDGQPNPHFRTRNTYNILSDKHEWLPSYNQPVQVDQMTYRNSDFRSLRRAKTTYDDWGCPLEITEWIWERDNQDPTMQKRIVATYEAASWGGELQTSEHFIDCISGYEKLVTYSNTSDYSKIQSSKVTYRENSTSEWKNWKEKSYIYDKSGRIIQETIKASPGAKLVDTSVKEYVWKRAYAFDLASGIYTETVIDPLGNSGSMSFGMRIPGGPLTAKVSPAGARETIEYDLFGRIIKMTSALGAITTVAYSVLPGQSTARVLTPTGYMTLRKYDVLGREFEVWDSGNEGASTETRQLSKTQYDMLSRVVKTINELKRESTQTYDALSRVVQSKDTFENVTTNEYDDSKRIVRTKLNGDLRTVALSDAVGRAIRTETYGDSQASRENYCMIAEKTYDGFGNVIQEKQSQKVLNGGATTILSQKDIVFDVEGKQLKVTTSTLPSSLTGGLDVVTRDFVFDIFGNAVNYTKTSTYADSRTFTVTGPLKIYDAGNRLVEHKNQRGQRELNEFSADGYLTKMTRYDGTQFHYTYDALGNMLSSTTPDGTTSYTYLANGNLASITKGTATVSHTYAPDGSIKQTQYPDGRKQIYVLDSLSRVRQEIDAAGKITENKFDDYGRVSEKRSGDNTITYEFGTVNHIFGLQNGFSVAGSQPYHRSIVFDGFGRQTQTTDRNPQGKVILNSLYLFDSRGRLIAQETNSEVYPTQPSINRKEQYQYDGLGQLIAHSRQYERDLAPARTETFSYDGNFNVIRRVTNGVADVRTYNTLDQRQDDGFAYDTNGRLIRDPNGRTYTYDAQDYLLTVAGFGATSYAYRPDGSLAMANKAEKSKSFYYSGGAVNAALDNDGTKSTWTSYLLHPKAHIAAITEGQGTSVYLEAQHSVRLTLQQGGSTTFDYDAFGQHDTIASDHKLDLGWQQELHDSENGLVYLRSRYYSSSTMGFITMDSSRAQENRYAYCNGDPINSSDGTGHDSTSEQIAGAVIAGAIVGTITAVMSGGALTLLGFEYTAASVTSIGVGSATVSGAVGTIAGDAVSAGILGQSFTGGRAGMDLLVGAFGGAVGAAVGDQAATTAMMLAKAREMTVKAINAIGEATSAIVGGASGGFAQSGMSAAIEGKDVFSANTALDGMVGAASGATFSRVSAGMTLADANKIPIHLSVREAGNVHMTQVPINDPAHIFSMIPPAQVVRLYPAGAAATIRRTVTNGPEFYTIDCHGDMGRLFATVMYKGEIITQPVHAKTFAKALLQHPHFQQQNPQDIKLLSCLGGFANAQRMASVLNVRVWGAYRPVNGRDLGMYHPFI